MRYLNYTLFRLIVAGFVGLFFFSPAEAQRQMEYLDRGVVAVRTSPGAVFISWRLMGVEGLSTSFNLYRDGKQLNALPMEGATCYVDSTLVDGVYQVETLENKVPVALSKPTEVWSTPYLRIPLQQPEGGVVPGGVSYTYSANDASVGDLDGDGIYEIILKWDPSNSKDNSQSGYTGNTFLDAYTLNGTRLWRIDLGKNIRSGAHYLPFLVYDFDGDGRAEVACRTADGTIDGIGKVIGDATVDYRNSGGYVLSGPEFLTVFEGITGKALDTQVYTPWRGTVSSWGDSYGNRVDRFLACVAYLDGVHPSMVFGRGYYTRLVRSAWDFRAGKLVQRWIFDSNTAGNAAYAGMGNHQMTVADANGDGRDEVYNGSSAVDYDGTGFFSNGLGHGDALHLSDMDPDRPGLEVWQCHEEPLKYGPYGLAFRDAKSGQPLWGASGGGADVGRALAADIDPRYKGYECWGARGGLYSCKGEQIGTSRPSMNHAVWWDGDLLRELLDGTKLDKWDYANNKSIRLASLNTEEYGFGESNNSTKANPCLTADILGDWREEILLRSADNQFLNLYTTTIPTAHRLYTLMHDPQYRLAIAWQNSGYNQPPHPGFYLGEGMAPAPSPAIELVAQTVTRTKEEKKRVQGAALYPNPTHAGFILHMPGRFSWEIVDLNGKKMGQGQGSEQVAINQVFPKGMYLVSVYSKSGSTTLKLIQE